MRKSLSLLLFVLVGCVASAQVNLSAGLVAYFPFSGDYLDHSGNGNNGTPHSMSFTTDQLGNPNSAASFDGSTGWIELASSLTLNPSTQFSIAFKFKTSSIRGQVMISKSDYINASNSTQNYEYSIGFNYLSLFGKDGLLFATDDYNSCATPPSYALSDYSFSGTQINANQWYCVVMTFDSSVKKIYVNGTLMNTQIVAGPYSNRIDSCPGGILKLGVWWKNDPEWFVGTMDEVRVYNRALNNAEISVLDSCAALTTTINSSFNITSVCQGSNFLIPYTCNGPYSAGNVFTAQISDSSGSFAAPVSIGSMSSTTSGTIACTLPAGTIPGRHYRVRIVTSNPSSVSDNNGRDIAVLAFTVPVITSNSPVCAGNPLVVTTIDTQSGVVYSWTGPHSYSTQSFTVPNAQQVDSGVYRLISVAPNGCRDTLVVAGSVISVGTTLTVTITANPGDLICFNFPVTFTAVASIGGVAYQWRVNGTNVPGATGNTYTTTGLVDGDAVTCIVTTASSCIVPNTANSNGITVHVTAGITLILSTVIYTPVKFVPGGTDTFSVNVLGYPSSDFTYQWRKNNVNIPGATTNPYITNTLHAGDKVTVMVKSKLPCSTPDSVLSNPIGLGVENISARMNVNLYPNPNNGSFIFTGLFPAIHIVNIEVINSIGQLVFWKDEITQNGALNTKLDLGNAQPGVYLLRVHTDNESNVLRFVVK